MLKLPIYHTLLALTEDDAYNVGLKKSKIISKQIKFILELIFMMTDRICTKISSLLSHQMFLPWVLLYDEPVSAPDLLEFHYDCRYSRFTMEYYRF